MVIEFLIIGGEMNNFIVNTEKMLSPIAEKITNKKLLIALRNSFAGFIPIIMIGSFALFLNLLIIDLPARFGITIVAESLSWLVVINNLIFNGTLGVVSLLFVFSIGFNVAKVYEVETLGGALIAFSSFIISIFGFCSISEIFSKALANSNKRFLPNSV